MHCYGIMHVCLACCVRRRKCRSCKWRRKFNVLLFTGTATRNGAIKWIQDAAERFTELKKDESYESGKKGVEIGIQDNKLIPYDNLSSDGNDIYLDEGRPDMYTHSASNKLMQLDEIVDYIENEQGLTIDADAKKRMLGYESADGQRHYYGLPQLLRTSAVRMEQQFDL